MRIEDWLWFTGLILMIPFLSAGRHHLLLISGFICLSASLIYNILIKQNRRKKQ